MALDFTTSPTTGAEYLAGAILWVYNGKGWAKSTEYQNGRRTFSVVYTVLTSESVPVVVAYV